MSKYPNENLFPIHIHKNGYNLKRAVVSIVIDSGDYNCNNRHEFKIHPQKIFRIRKIKKLNKECMNKNKVDYATDNKLVDKLFAIKNTVTITKKSVI
jgi:hypothetical protein